MRIIEWIKSRIKYDTDHQLISGKHSLKQTNKQTQSQTRLQEIYLPKEDSTHHLNHKQVPQTPTAPQGRRHSPSLTISTQELQHSL